MARRFIGDASVDVVYVGSRWMGGSERDVYRGRVMAAGLSWPFDDIGLVSGAYGAADSPEAYDAAAATAVHFGAYYTSGNRGRETPPWAPAEDVADAIDEATSHAMDEQMRYFVRRQRGGPGRWTAEEERRWPTGAERSRMPPYQQLAVTRHENEAVLDALRVGATDRRDIAKRTGLSQFQVAVVLQRLQRAGLVELT